MAIQNSILFVTNVFGDDTSTAFSLDLKKDVYSLQESGQGPATTIENWDNRPSVTALVPLSTGVYSGTINKDVITVNFATPPASGVPTGVAFYLLMTL